MSLKDIVIKLFQPLVLGLCVASAGCGNKSTEENDGDFGATGSKQCFQPWVKDKIVVSNRNEIFLVDDDGNNLVPLIQADNNHYYSLPTWSPNGKYIAYVQNWYYSGTNNSDSHDSYLKIIGVDGTNEMSIIPASVNSPRDVDYQYLKWSPDGRKIALGKTYRTNPPRPAEFSIVDLISGSETVIGNSGVPPSFRAEWSPDGSKLTYDDIMQTNEIYVTNTEGTNIKNLTNHPAIDASPSWSPDGGKIVFVSKREYNTAIIWSMKADGTEQKKLIDSSGVPVIGYEPAWSPIGDKIALKLDWASGIGVFSIAEAILKEVDSSLLPLDPGTSIYLISWSTDGQKIAYPTMKGISVGNVNSGELIKIADGEMTGGYAPCL